ncbi:septum formation family protein [Nocardioides mangrovi]|uniref:Septum formation family protein n=1 Tax=Nocardioides mangrovi TaxID=2874580 RepID=A0ABS7UJ48_9ACTN|nr:septum formation family protein [Nocardioides mangrovi]MBZ5741031.1 septum formation family protein [Nocardioides mangrovi]
MKVVAVLVAALAVLALGACTGSDETPDAPTSTSATPSATATPEAAPSPPGPRACHDLTYDAAVAPTDEADPVDCAARHTTMTFAVGRLDTQVDGHLLAVDSDRVREQVATECPQRFATFVGGTLEQRRLSMLRTVWFTPTVAESDAGASWFRCDVAALAGDDELTPLAGRLAGVLNSEETRDRYAMCGTAQPGSPDFARVICSSKHSWRAVATVTFAEGDYPGVDEVRSAGDTPCKDAGAAASGGSLDYQWGYEWPTAAQWKAGQTYGICWVPST